MRRPSPEPTRPPTAPRTRPFHPRPRASRARTWAGRIAFLASTLALVATSKPAGWTLTATLAGPTTAPPSRGLAVRVDASAPPRLRATGVAPNPYGDADTPCAATWRAGATLSCLLPPGATLAAVEIGGTCGGCSGACAPPPSAFARATTTPVDVWQDAVTRAIPTTLPAHGPRWIATRLQVVASGAAFYRAELRVRAKGGGAPLVREEQSLRGGAQGMPAGHAYALFLVGDDAVPPGAAYDVDVEVTGWGECSAGGGCAPPKTLAVTSFEVLP